MNSKIIIKAMGLMFVCLLYTGTGCQNFFNNDGFKAKKVPKCFEFIFVTREFIDELEARIKTLTDDAIACNKDNPTSIIKLHAAKTLSLRLSTAKEICKNMESLALYIEDNDIECNLGIIATLTSALKVYMDILTSEIKWVSKMIPYVEKIDEDILLEAMSGESIDQLRNIDTDEALNEIFNEYSKIVIQSL